MPTSVQKVAARGIVFEYSPDGTTYTQVGDLTSLAPGNAEQEADLTTFGSLGDAEHWVMERSGTIAIEGFRTGDAGQVLVETAGRAKAAASLVFWRITWPLRGGTTAEKWTFKGSVRLGDGGGGNNDAAKFSATIKRSGALTVVAEV